MRLFVAVVPPPVVVADLERALARHRDAAVRWTGSAQWHVTLCFLGEVAADSLDPLVAGLGAVAERTAPLRLALRGAGRFGDRVLWAGVAGETARLAVLAGAVREAAGAGADEHPFRPHLTLAYGRADLDPLVEALQALGSDAWQADEIVLFQSSPGPVYTPLRAWPLSG
ncbi:RNA 2',3'-cyclic phosphodiesterase [Pseudonocardia pini]|uniref:RNA 2',3'-cyclic phosphodiesterase n=1 Tax=Pseudonocardia pini TaxID=2758030 RepID=UPI0028AC99A5|nr:RNA 2',3'-cyclic phosphodiesterase [Pseudonocardia pini]